MRLLGRFLRSSDGSNARTVHDWNGVVEQHHRMVHALVSAQTAPGPNAVPVSLAPEPVGKAQPARRQPLRAGVQLPQAGPARDGGAVGPMRQAAPGGRHQPART